MNHHRIIRLDRSMCTADATSYFHEPRFRCIDYESRDDVPRRDRRSSITRIKGSEFRIFDPDGSLGASAHAIRGTFAARYKSASRDIKEDGWVLFCFSVWENRRWFMETECVNCNSRDTGILFEENSKATSDIFEKFKKREFVSSFMKTKFRDCCFWRSDGSLLYLA